MTKTFSKTRKEATGSFRVLRKERLRLATESAGIGTWDVDPDGSGVVTEQRTYQLIRQPGAVGDRLFEVEFSDSGVEAYCFTFG